MLRAIILRTIDVFLIALAIVRFVFIYLIIQVLLYFVIRVVELCNFNIEFVIYFFVD